jgi:hypothetical protein
MSENKEKNRRANRQFLNPSIIWQNVLFLDLWIWHLLTNIWNPFSQVVNILWNTPSMVWFRGQIYHWFWESTWTWSYIMEWINAIALWFHRVIFLSIWNLYRQWARVWLTYLAVLLVLSICGALADSIDSYTISRCKQGWICTFVQPFTHWISKGFLGITVLCALPIVMPFAFLFGLFKIKYGIFGFIWAWMETFGVLFQLAAGNWYAFVVTKMLPDCWDLCLLICYRILFPLYRIFVSLILALFYIALSFWVLLCYTFSSICALLWTFSINALKLILKPVTWILS